MFYFVPLTTYQRVFDTLPTGETCPYCQRGQLHMSLGQSYMSMLGLCMAQPRFGIATCEECGNELAPKKWSPQLKEFYKARKGQYRLSGWQRFSLVGFAVVFFGFLFAMPKLIDMQTALPPGVLGKKPGIMGAGYVFSAEMLVEKNKIPPGVMLFKVDMSQKAYTGACPYTKHVTSPAPLKGSYDRTAFDCSPARMLQLDNSSFFEKNELRVGGEKVGKFLYALDR